MPSETFRLLLMASDGRVRALAPDGQSSASRRGDAKHSEPIRSNPHRGDATADACLLPSSLRHTIASDCSDCF